RLIARGMVGLYRWYLAESQARRNWSPSHSFDWRALRTDHSPELNIILEGFFAVEQYIPDYTSKTISLSRKNYGHSQFQIRWGAEEEKHADLWLNVLLFSRFRTPQWIEQYQEILRNKEWQLPWEDAFHMVIYALIQERATQLNYLNAALIARGQSDLAGFENEADPVLVKVAQTIATDEAAHYSFFLEVARLYLYYYPAQTLDALFDVIEHFAMPGMDLVPNIAELTELLYRSAIYGPRQYARDVLQAVLDQLSLAGRKELERAVRRSREVPDDGITRDTCLFSELDYEAVEVAVQRLFGRIQQYERDTGLAEIHPTQFVPSGFARL
ncbi:MAG TPA: acyl-ACP desaturase, partial [Chloroflexota bacterium]|nr:acyl-ACP desaturase [Chloroflexota bacterium]